MSQSGSGECTKVAPLSWRHIRTQSSADSFARRDPAALNGRPDRTRSSAFLPHARSTVGAHRDRLIRSSRLFLSVQYLICNIQLLRVATSLFPSRLSFRRTKTQSFSRHTPADQQSGPLLSRSRGAVAQNLFVQGHSLGVTKTNLERKEGACA